MSERTSGRLVLDGAGEPPRVVRLVGSVSFGRNQGNDHVFGEDEAAVSAVHATIVQQRGRYTIRDEASTSGTFVNAHRVSEQELRDGDLVEFGLDGPSGRFQTVLTDEPPPAAEPSGLLARIGRALFGRRVD